MSDKAIDREETAPDQVADDILEARHSLKSAEQHRHSFVLGGKVALSLAAGLVGFSFSGLFTETAVAWTAVPVAALLGFYFLADFYADALSEAINDRQEVLRSLRSAHRNLDFLDRLWSAKPDTGGKSAAKRAAG